jgi:hypothetical protein
MTPEEATSLQQRHIEAMSLCESAAIARASRENARATELFRRAFELEREAAQAVAGEPDLEPTRSVLHRSAAALAIECGEYRAAEKLISAALAGDPPDEIAEELRDLLEQVHLERHLDLRGLELAPDELQMSIEGHAIGFGLAQSDEFVDRVQTSEKLILRTIERKMGRPFRETGKAIKEIARNFELYLSVPRASSFAVTLRVGLPQKQLFLPNIEQEVLWEPGKIIDDLLECLQTFGEKDQGRLRELIPDETYRRNFVALAERMAPDGDQVKVVGFTIVRRGQERRVALVKRHVEERAIRNTDRVSTVIVGRLLFANATSSTRKRIRIVDDDGVQHSLIVPEGMMADIVKPLWEERVKATAVRRGKTLYLDRVERARAEATPADLVT